MEKFSTAIADVSATAASIQSQGRKIIGCLCSYTPEEIIHAAGFHPMRLFTSKSDITFAEGHLQPYCCSLVRGILEDSLSGRLDFLYGAVFPHTCDSVQRLSDIWRMNGRYAFFSDIVLPVKLSTASARNYMINVLNRFKSQLEMVSGRQITRESLTASIETFNIIRRNLAVLYDLKSRYPELISAGDLYSMVKGAMIMDRDNVADLLPQAVKTLERKGSRGQNSKRIVVSGSVCDFPGIYTVLESAGAAVVGDDLCTGQRWFEGEIETTGDPVTAIADRYMNRVICPAKHTSVTARAEKILSLAEKKRADGVVFVLLKFCEPHAFDYPYLKECLDKKGIKTLLIEMDKQQENMGQVTTRIETFLEMI